MDGFAMKLDLSNFFADARSCSLVLIDTTWSNVKDLQDHIQKLFQLTNISLLTNDGCYLPPKESIMVVKAAESLKAFTLNFDEAQKNCTIQNAAEISRKRKNRSVETEKELISSTPNFPKRSKCKPVAADDATFLELAPKKDTSIDLNGKSAKKNKSKLQNVEPEKELEEEPLEATAPLIQSIHLQTTNTDVGNLSFVQAPNTTNNHIIYQDDAMETEPENCTAEVAEAAIVVEFRCPLMELDVNTVRTFKLPRKSDPIKILENIIIPPPISHKSPEAQNEVPAIEAETSTQVVADAEVVQKIPTPVASPCLVEKDTTALEEEPVSEKPTELAEQSLLTSDSEDDVMVLDDTILDDSDSTDVQAVPEKNDMSMDMVLDMLQNAVALDNLPNMGETLIFKLAKYRNQGQSKNSKSSYTDYMAGTCSYVNRRTKQITIHVIACPRGISHILRQYSNNCESSFDATPNLNVNFKELIDAKVIVSEVD